MKKNLFTFLLAMLIAIAANAEIASGTCGTKLTWSLSDDYTLTISGIGAMTSYGSTSKIPWLISYKTNIKNVVIEEGVTSISQYAFHGCSYLTGITIPQSVSSIGIHAFDGCSSLTNVTIPDGVAAIDNYTFSGCSSLINVTIPERVTLIGSYAFSGCSSLSTITIPDNVAAIGICAFKSCSSLTSIIIPNGVTSIGSEVFSGCTGLVSITLPFIGSSANETSASSSTLFGYFFGSGKADGETYVNQYYFGGNTTYRYIPSSLREVTVTGGKLFYGTFSGCSMLTSVKFLNGITEVGEKAFYNCDNLESVTIGDEVKNIGNDAFYGCSKLNSNVVGNSLQSIGSGAFSGCNSISTLDLPASLSIIGANALDGMAALHTINMLGANPPALENATALNNFTTIYVEAEALNNFLQDETWKDHTAQIIAQGIKTDYDATVTALADKSALHIEIGEANLQNVVNLKVSGTINSYDLMLMRNKMVNLKHLDLSNASIVDNAYEYFNNKGDGYHSVANTLTRYALQPNLFSIKLPSSLTTINDRSLQELKHVEEIEIPANVTSIGIAAAKNLSLLKSITFEENSKLESINDSAFYECSSIKELSIPGSVKTMSGKAINQCSSLEKLTLEDGEGVLSLSSSIDDNKCPLKEAYIGRNLTGGLYIGALFYYKLNLSKVTIGEGVTTIPNKCFYGSSCKELIVPSSLYSIGTDAFYRNSTTDIYITDVNAWSNISGLETLMSTTTAKNIYLNGEKIETLDLKGVVTMQPYAFEHATITGVNIPTNSTLAKISDYAFAYTNLNKIQMPVSITAVGDYSFNSCPNLTEVKLPSSIHGIGNHAFDECPNLYDVYTYTIEPQVIDQFTFSTYKSATLHCPKVSYYNYFYNTQWSQFLKLVDFDEEYDYIFIDKDVTLDDNTGAIGGEPDTDINPGGGLVVDDDLEQNLGDVHIKFDGTSNIGASIIGSRIHAHKIYLDIEVVANKWYFFCFPFDVDLVTVQKSGGYVFRYYDGQKRAEGQNGWTDIAAGTEHLNAGEGYIFRTNEAGTLTVCIAKKTVEAENIDINNTDEFTTLYDFTAESSDNKSWNFVGNKYLSYYDINDLAYGAPIVIWNGTSYEAFRPGDDDMVLYPFQAFFVQKPENVENVGFEADSRMTYLQSQDKEVRSAKRRAKAAKLNRDRKLINLTITDGENTDKTRVVFNNKQQLTFEAECDATKFSVANDIPQMYSLDADNTKYSINERPVSDGKVKLAIAVPAKGEYTINATRMDAHVFLEDAATGTLHDLQNGDYTFETEAGTFAQRFTLILADDEATAIKVLNNSNTTASEGDAYDMSGRRVKNAKGIVIKGDKKIMVK